MCETSSRWSMKNYQTELLRQDNSVLLAKVVRLEQELSQSQEMVQHCASIATELAATVGGAHWALVDTLEQARKSPQLEELLGVNTSGHLKLCQLRLQNSYRIVSDFSYLMRQGGGWAGTPKKTVWSYLSSIFRVKRKDRSSVA